MDQEDIYSREQIEEICGEVKKRWEYHLISRAPFPFNIMKVIPEYVSSPYHIQQGAELGVRVPVPLSPLMERSLGGIGHWLNQNYILRLFGILEEFSVITAGKKVGNVYTRILATLRHNVGAHSRGHYNPDRSEVQQVTRLIQEHLDPTIQPDDVVQFTLSISPVLDGLTENCLIFVRSLEGKPRPLRKQGSNGD